MFDVVHQRFVAIVDVLHERSEAVEGGGLVLQGRNLVFLRIGYAVVPQLLQFGLAACELQQGRGHFGHTVLKSIMQSLKFFHFALLLVLTHGNDYNGLFWLSPIVLCI